MIRTEIPGTRDTVSRMCGSYDAYDDTRYNGRRFCAGCGSIIR